MSVLIHQVFTKNLDGIECSLRRKHGDLLRIRYGEMIEIVDFVGS